MGRFIDLTGQRFGMLNVEKRVPCPRNLKSGSAWWRCNCDCGGQKDVSSSNLIAGDTKSCGCMDKTGFIDLVGMRFGNLLVIERAKNNKYNQSCWMCLCDCGNHIVVRGGSLKAKNHGTKSCGCISINLLKNNTIARLSLDGQKFGKLTVLEFSHIDKRQTSFWKCVCDCGNLVTKRGTSLTRGITKSCGCLHYEISTIEPGLASFHNLFASYKLGALYRGISFDLTEEEFRELTKGNCYYCGEEPSKIRKITSNGEYVFNGIDRMISEDSYRIGNVVSCCWNCNRLKGDMKLNFFLSHMQKILENMKNK
jgi:hypothetical protein